MAPTMKRQGSTSPFEVAFESKGQFQRGSTVTTAFTDRCGQEDDLHIPRPINYYINETYKKWKNMYMQVISNKEAFNNSSPASEFYTAFVQESNDFAREIFLDATQCDNPCFALPQLTRENYNQKGLFYRTEKVIVQNYSNYFQRHSVEYTRQILWDLSQRIQNELAKNERIRELLAGFVTSELEFHSDNQADKGLVKSTKIPTSASNDILTNHNQNLPGGCKIGFNFLSFVCRTDHITTIQERPQSQ